MTRSTVRLVLAISFLLASMPPPALAIGELVWEVRIDRETTSLVRNDFPLQQEPAGKRALPFPLSALRVRKFENRSTYGPHGGGTDLRTYVAPLFVNPDGTLAGSLLKFVKPGRVSLDVPSRDSFLYLAQSLAERDALAMTWAKSAQQFSPVRYLDRVESQNQEVLDWELSSDGRRAVAHTEFQTLFLEEDPSKTAHLRIRTAYPHFTYDVSISRQPERIAAVALTEAENERVVVFSFDGDFLYEGENRECYSYSDLFLSPSGEALVFRRVRKRDDPETVALDLRTDATKVLMDVVEGDRYYSRDGTHMAVLWGGRASYYDTSDPFNAELLWTYNARPSGPPPPLPPEEGVDGQDHPRWLSGGGLGVGNDLIITGAVSDDGSYVALQIRNRPPPGVPHSSRVVVLDEAMNQVAEPTGATKLEGLHFEGKVLFLGYQKHPVPVGLCFFTTKWIRAYSFAE